MNDFSSYATFLESLGAQKKLKGFRHNGVHITVNTIHELAEAERNIQEFALIHPQE